MRPQLRVQAAGFQETPEGVFSICGLKIVSKISRSWWFDHLFSRYLQQLNQMIEKKQGNWISMEASVGLHCELFDSNSRFLGKIKEEEISQGFRFYTGDAEENYHPINYFSNENTLNFIDLQQRFNTDKQSTNTPLHNLIHSIHFEEKYWAPNETNSKRGLKHLASLLLKAFEKKKFTSLGEVIEQIQSQLLPQNNSSLANQKEQKNIKRRIYDALNVMLSAGILQKGMLSLAKNTQHYSKNYGIVCKKSTYTQQIISLEDRIERKRELLKQLKSKKQALSTWVQKKKQSNIHEKQQNKLHFPLVIMAWSNLEGSIWMESEQNTLLVYAKGGELYSQTDLLEQFILQKYRAESDHELIKKQSQQFLDKNSYI